MIIFCINIQTRFKYICYLNIFRFIYIITELIHIQKDSTQNPHINL